MKISNYILLLFLINFINCSNTLKRDSNNFDYEIPNNTKKSIITTHYKPILHENNWICGEIMADFNHKLDTVYYDEFDNVLLSKTKFLIDKYFYLSPKDSKESKHYIWYIDFEENIAFDSILFVRDDNKNLIEVKVGEKVPSFIATSTKFKYDDKGNRTEIIEDNRTTIINLLPSKENIITNSYKIFENKKGENILNETFINIYEKKSEKLIRQIHEYYKYGKLDKKYLKRYEDITYIYNENGFLIKEKMKGKCVALYYNIPQDIIYDEEKSEEYVEEHYYRNIKYIPIGYLKEWKYNSQNDVDEFIFKQFNIYTEKLELDVYNSEKYEYEYNEKNEWISKVTYRQYINETNTADKIIRGIPDKIVRNNQPYIITIREIQYY